MILFIPSRGAGSLVFLIVLLSFILTAYAMMIYFNSHTISPDILVLISMLIAATVCWFFGRHINSKPVIYTDPNTGKEVVIKGYHHYIFIRMEYWGIIFFLIGLLLIVKKLLEM